MSTTDELCDTLKRTIRNRVPFFRIKVPDLLTRLKIPREGGPGITRSDLLVINKIDLAPFVGASLGVTEADTLKMRGKRPFVFSNLKSGEGVEPIANFIIETGGLAKNAA
jgi:urease accessory protein